MAGTSTNAIDGLRPREVAAPKDRTGKVTAPYLLFLGYAFLYYAYPWIVGHIGGHSLRIMMIVLLANAGWLVLDKTLAREPFLLSWPDTHLLLVFLATGVISVSNSLWPSATLDACIEISKGILVYFLLINVITTRRRLRTVFWAFVLGAGIAAGNTLSKVARGIVDGHGRARYAGVFENPNDLAVAMIIVLPLAIGLLYGANLRQRVILGGVIAMLPATVFYTFSRGGLVGLATALGIIGLRANNAGRFVLFLAIIAVIAAYPLYADQWTREEGFSELGGDYSFMGRIFSIEIGTQMFLDNPWTGVGLGASALGMWEYVGWYEFYMSIHNTFAQLFAEVGLFGGLAYLGALAISLIGADRVSRSAKRRGDLELMYFAVTLESSLIAFLVCAMAGPYLNSWSPLLLIALSSALRYVDTQEKLAESAASPAQPSPAT